MKKINEFIWNHPGIVLLIAFIITSILSGVTGEPYLV